MECIASGKFTLAHSLMAEKHALRGIVQPGCYQDFRAQHPMYCALVGSFKQLGALGVLECAGKFDRACDFVEFAVCGLALGADLSVNLPVSDLRQPQP